MWHRRRVRNVALSDQTLHDQTLHDQALHDQALHGAAEGERAVRDAERLQAALNVLGGLAFSAGSLLFLDSSLMRVGAVLFVLGSFAMAGGALAVWRQRYGRRGAATLSGATLDSAADEPVRAPDLAPDLAPAPRTDDAAGSHAESTADDPVPDAPLPPIRMKAS